MKTYIVIIAITIFLVQCKNDSSNQTKSNVNSSVEFKGKPLGIPLDNIHKKEAEYGIKLKFVTIETVHYDFNGDKRNDTIKIERIVDWGDPGDFHKITISLSGKGENVFFNSGGWIAIGDYELQFVKDFVSKSIVPSEYISLQRVSSTDILLFCFGYVYASQPGLLSVINITNNDDSRLIFNDNYYLYKFEDFDNDGVKDIVLTKSDTEESNSKNDLKYYKFIDGWYRAQ